ncbi:hypothetical protein [Zhihengliuella halotolerans]|uniref:Uncharacterized protein n=1 Tax=Zhihengliuella halotolerans TaxID=370736 RepID=A0A4Q8AIE3_9MICC|nr:hypothetical protein [Zhihengliuella halotolerans]RZU63509.1 hypothetical protein EV380_3130 [Zhihengliuella halotolerans]
MTDPHRESFDVDALLEEAGIADAAALRDAVESLHAAGSMPAPVPTGPLADLLEGRLTAAEAAAAAGISAGSDDNVIGFDPAKPRKRRGGAVTGGLTVVALAAAAGLAGVAAADVPPRAASPVVNVTVPTGELTNKPERPTLEASNPPEPTPERVVHRDPIPTPTTPPAPAPVPAPKPTPTPAPAAERAPGKKPGGAAKVLNPGKLASTLPKSVPVKPKTKRP